MRTVPIYVFLISEHIVKYKQKWHIIININQRLVLTQLSIPKPPQGGMVSNPC